jgi:hypothetical protein
MNKPKKQSKAEMLPSRGAMATIVKGDSYQRSMQNYAKKTPSGRGAIGPGLMQMFMK